MKKILIHFSIMLLILASSQNALIWIDYHINQSFYEEYCANKAKPELDCHGKCKVKEKAEKETSQFNIRYAFEIQFLPTKQQDFIGEFSDFSEYAKPFIKKSNNPLQGFLQKYFHPPTLG